MPSFSLEYVENGQTQSFPFDSSSVSVGRDKTSDFVLDHPTVSRQHALIVHNQRGFQLVVLSRGGMTAIDGNPVSGDVDLFDGNVLHFGQLNFTFRSAEAPQKAQSNGSGGSGQYSQPGGMGQGMSQQQPANFGGPQQTGGFGGQQQGGGFAGQQQGGGFGGQQQGGGFGGQQQGGGFGGQQQGGGFAGQQQGGGFGGQQQGGGFGGQQQGGDAGFGMAGAGAAAGGQQQGGGFGPPGGGGFGPPGGMGGGQPEPEEPKDPNGIMSWDEIAQSAEAMGDDHVDNQTDFQRIQAAQAKAVEQSKGTNPALVVVAGALIVGLLGYSFWPQDGGGGGIAEQPLEERPDIKWDEKTTDCIGEADCMKKAERAFAVGVDYIEKQDVELSFLFLGYKNLKLADIFVEKAGKERPAKFARADSAREEARQELNLLFKKFQVEYHNAETRKMYRDMASVIARVKTYFPYKGAKEHQWAIERENDMKDRGIYPKNPFGR